MKVLTLFLVFSLAACNAFAEQDEVWLFECGSVGDENQYTIGFRGERIFSLYTNPGSEREKESDMREVYFSRSPYKGSIEWRYLSDGIKLYVTFKKSERGTVEASFAITREDGNVLHSAACT